MKIPAIRGRRTSRATSALFVLASSLCMAEPIDSSRLSPEGSIGYFWFLSAMLVAPAVDPSVYFGCSVDMSGDFLVVGTEDPTDDGGTLAGRVHVYRREGATWQLDASLVSPAGAQSGALFGLAVALASTPDGVVLVIGEPGRDRLTRGNTTTDAGTVWLYERVDGVWQSVELQSIPAPDARLGLSVDTDGSHVIAGGPGYEGGAGETVVWRRQGNTWVVDAYHTALGAGSAYGFSVALQGDRALVGAPGASYIGHAGAGLALITNLLFDDETFGAVLHDPTPATGESFGHAVAAMPDRFVVGSFFDDAPGGDPDSGAVHVFRLEGDVPQLESSLRSPVPQEGARFGWVLAYSGDRLVVGEPERTIHLLGDTLTSAGAVHLFRQMPQNESWIYETGLYNFASNEQMGWSVAADGQRVAAGVPTRPLGAATFAGAVDVFESDRIFADGFE